MVDIGKQLLQGSALWHRFLFSPVGELERLQEKAKKILKKKVKNANVWWIGHYSVIFCNIKLRRSVVCWLGNLD